MRIRSRAPEREIASPPRAARTLVDDNRDSAGGLAQLLQLFGTRSAGLQRPRGRWRRAQPADLVLLDIRMPDLNGYEVARSVPTRRSPARPWSR
jgi:DNA-binding response OmpR family regulator